jgi:hypothetical protein
MRRPLGITIVCLVLGWLTIGAVGNSYLILAGEFGLPWYHGVLAAAYGVSTLSACVGLWRMNVQGLYWLRAWMIICFVLILATVPVFGIPLGGALFILALQLVVSWVLNRYVGGHVQRVA